MSQPILDALKEEALPQVAQALRAARERIVERWRAEVVRELPRADTLTLRSLDDSVPDLLAQMADALASRRDAPSDQFFHASPAHGEVRFHQEFNLAELLTEYHLLRRVLVEEVSRERARPLEVVECVAVNSGIDVALRQAIIEYSRHQAALITAEAESMAKYLSFLSHDLRGGLNGSILMIEVLRRELMNEPRFAQSMEDLDMMRRSMLETVATMDRFLHAERLRRGKMPVKLGDVDLARLVGQVTRNVSYQIQDKNVRVETQVNCAGVIRTDAEVVTITLTNLLSNAIKYAGGKPVRVEANPRADGGVRISVIDNGAGIPPETLSKLFAPFQRGETYGQKGSGLGLSIARQAAELIGATLHAESGAGAGTAFHLDLPSQTT